MKGYEIGDIFTGHMTNSHRANFFQQFEEYIQQQRQGKCQVYWGKHACHEQHGPNHPPEHRCRCGTVPFPWSVLWGNHLNAREIAQIPERQEELRKVENRYSWHDEFDKKGNYRPNRRRGNQK